MAQYTFRDNSNEVLRELRSRIDSVAGDIRQTMIEAVQEKILYGYNEAHGEDGHTEIVDTGRLFESIDAEAERKSQNLVEVTVGATGETPYAVYVHNGTRKLKGRPFITDAVNEKRLEIRRMIKEGLETE